MGVGVRACVDRSRDMVRLLSGAYRFLCAE